VAVVILRSVDVIGFGRAVRALRRHRGWRQKDLAGKARVSRAAIWRIEAGRAGRVTLDTLDRVAVALGARLVTRLDWNGAALVKLLDGDHATLVDLVIGYLRSAGWTCVPEVTFNIYGDRGSIDILAWHEPSGSLLVIEVKTLVPDVGDMLATLDRKRRLAARIGSDRGWHARSVSTILVIRESATNRRHVAALDQTFARALPDRNVAVKRWIAAPAGSIAGLWFFSIAHQASARTRIRPPIAATERDPRPGSSRMPP
jgi:transcriptional regulator with XRE-family HTH domain